MIFDDIWLPGDECPETQISNLDSEQFDKGVLVL